MKAAFSSIMILSILMLPITAVKAEKAVKPLENSYIKVLKQKRVKAACLKGSKKANHCISLRVRCKLPMHPAHVNLPLAVITWFDNDGIPVGSSPSMGTCSYPGEVATLKIPIPKKEKSYKVNLLPVYIKSLENTDFSRW